MITANEILKELESYSTQKKRDFLPYFFKTGKGQYGEGDKFLGVVVPDSRKIAKKYKGLSFDELTNLLNSEWHECRLCALLILVERFNGAEEDERKELYDFYLAHTHRINNWDLVDLSAPHIVGQYLLDKDRTMLYHLADSHLLWNQRIAVLSTFPFIRNKDFEDIWALSEKLMNNKHDLMHKAIGWMLREVGKRDDSTLRAFLNKHHKTMPRTMLRYSIEKLTPDERKHYMQK